MGFLMLAILIILLGFIGICVLFATHFSKALRSLNADVGRFFKDANTELGSRLETATRAVSDVHEHLGRLEESQRRLHEVGRDIASLQELLRAPKIRGGIGELFLEELLNQIMPKEFFTLQHEFKNNQRVDAVVRFGQGMVPVDAKFPLENFRKLLDAENDDQKKLAKRQFVSDVKQHIRSISEKYILPDEGTFDFALMYIPAENVYYETIIKDEKFDEEGGLFQYAVSKKVMPVSPNSFYAYLRVILLGLKGMAIEKGAKEIIKGLAQLRTDFNKFYADFVKMGRHISFSKTSYEEALKRLERVEGKLARIESPSATAEITQ